MRCVHARKATVGPTRNPPSIDRNQVSAQKPRLWGHSQGQRIPRVFRIVTVVDSCSHSTNQFTMGPASANPAHVKPAGLVTNPRKPT